MEEAIKVIILSGILMAAAASTMCICWVLFYPIVKRLRAAARDEDKVQVIFRFKDEVHVTYHDAGKPIIIDMDNFFEQLKEHYREWVENEDKSAQDRNESWWKNGGDSPYGDPG